MDCSNPTRDFFATELMKDDNVDNPPLELKRLVEYVSDLKEERRKIEAFKRELPLCFDLLNKAVEMLEMELRKGTGSVECNLGKGVEDMKSWMSSVQLWNYNGSDSHELKSVNGEESVAKEVKVQEELIKKNCTDNQHLLKQPVAKTDNIYPCGENMTLSKGNILVGDLKVNKKIQGRCWSPHQICRKQRKCWPHELHRRFVDALHELGGSEVATPKQIRDIMRVEGLTNDEVKSHLQKYRLHIRKAPQSTFSPTLNSPTASHDDHFSKSNIKSSHSVSPLGHLDISPVPAKHTASDNTTIIEDDGEEETEGQSWRLQNRVSSVYRPSLPTC